VSDSIVDEAAQLDAVMLTRSIIGRQAYVRGDFMQVNVGDSSDIMLAATATADKIGFKGRD
jgi:glucose-1-phosphate thymidylyltransferase